MADTPPRPLLPVRGPVRQDLRLKDGTRLVADIWRPDTQDSLPVLLMRQPYGRAIASTVTLAHPAWYAARGYIVAIQDVRGRFESEGEWYAFAKEAPDGYDAVQWLGAQPWSDGKTGTMGDSYAGSDQSALATLNPSSLATTLPALAQSCKYRFRELQRYPL